MSKKFFYSIELVIFYGVLTTIFAIASFFVTLELIAGATLDIRRLLVILGFLVLTAGMIGIYGYIQVIPESVYVNGFGKGTFYPFNEYDFIINTDKIKMSEAPIYKLWAREQHSLIITNKQSQQIVKKLELDMPAKNVKQLAEQLGC